MGDLLLRRRMLMRAGGSSTPTLHPFSVSANTQVYFSPGNLQWSATNGGTTATSHATADGSGGAGTWRFAEHQWDFVGDATSGNVYGVGGNSSAKCNNAQISSTYQGWIDFFGWGTSGYNSKYPYMTSLTNTDYGNGTNNITGTDYDWGVYNAIYNPRTKSQDAAGTWRTLTNAEWTYLLGTTPGTRGGINSDWWIYNIVTITAVDGTGDVSGLIIYPDGVTAQPSGLSKTLTKNNTTNVNITKADFDNLEAMGCVFLPAAGYRAGTSAGNVKLHGNYWSSTNYASGTVYYLAFQISAPGVVQPSYTAPRSWGRSVRLAKDAI